MVTISAAYLRGLLHQAISTPAGLTSLELSAVLMIVLVTGLVVVFRGNDSWKSIFTVAGLISGGYVAYNLSAYPGFSVMPVYLAVAIGALAGAVLLTYATVAGLSAGFGLLTYLIVSEYVPNPAYYAFPAGIAAIVIAVLLYRNHVHIVACFIGVFAMYYALIRLGVADHYAAIASIVVFTAGAVLEEYDKHRRDRKLEESRTHYHQAKHEVRPEKE